MIINDIMFNAELEDILEELRNQLMLNKISYFQRDPKRSGNSLQVQCPYHGDGQEKKPSAGIRKSDGMFHCFACNEIHSLPEVISHCFGYTDDLLGKEGWKWLLKNFATLQIESRKEINLDFGRESRKMEPNNFVSEKELDEYRYYHPYWRKRGITDNRIIELFDLGYDPKTKCITFPVRDRRGNCLFVARRSINTKMFNYPEGVEKPLYGIYELSISNRDTSEIFICESMIDCILLWQAGFVALALNGTGNELQYNQLKDLSCRKIILATDNDEAGKRSRYKLRNNIRNKLVTEIQFPERIKDIGDLGAENPDKIRDIKKFEIF